MRKQLWAAAALTVALVACSGGSKGTESPPLTVAAGGCCGDPNSCRSNICAPSLHCGASQTPSPVYVCCADGSFCCATDSDCQDHFPGGACNTATSTCFTSCATDDDTRCAAGYHCETSTCAADVANGTGTCDEASDCASGNCSVAFDPNATTSICAPAGACANGNQSLLVGYTLCTGSAFSRRCDATGQWSAPTYNPQPAGQTCDAGGGAASGFRYAATCTSGLDDVHPGFGTTCTSCFPYRASASDCLTDATGCAGSDANCWAGYHCSPYDAGNVCVSNANGSPCDLDTQCTSGRCTAAHACGNKLDLGSSCAKGSDCKSGACNTVCTATCVADSNCAPDHFCDDNSHSCVSTLALWSPCTRAAMCQVGVCYLGHCGPAGSCVVDSDCATGSCWLQYHTCD